MSKRQKYNAWIRRFATGQSMQFGFDTPAYRAHQACWIRRIRNEYPMSQFGITWGLS